MWQLSTAVFRIALSDDALLDFNSLDARWRSAVREALDAHLRHQPMLASKSRIKRLRDSIRPQYRLRVDDIRVFYDVLGDTVFVLGIVPKDNADAWLKQFHQDNL